MTADPKKTAVESSSARPDPNLAARLKDAADLLEAISSNRALLAQVPEEERVRLLQAAGRVSRPDAVDRRRLRKAQLRQRKSEKNQRDSAQIGCWNSLSFFCFCSPGKKG